MGILEAAKPAIVICTTDRARAAAFYGDTLGLITASPPFSTLVESICESLPWPISRPMSTRYSASMCQMWQRL